MLDRITATYPTDNISKPMASYCARIMCKFGCLSCGFESAGYECIFVHWTALGFLISANSMRKPIIIIPLHACHGSNYSI